MNTSEWYRRFADVEARGSSACYEAWARGVAGDRQLLALVDELPEPKRQPNLVFAAARFVGIGTGPFGAFREQLVERWPQVRAVALQRRTQTNECGRSAVLLPLLAALEQPLALVEVGASAGLCLYPDRFSYRYGDRPDLHPAAGPGPLLRCATTGPVPVPQAVPEIAWRAGVDLNPLDVTDPDDTRWLHTLIWPEHDHRREQLAAALALARAEPPTLQADDLNDTIDELIDRVPAGATPVVFHSAVLAYLDDEARTAFTARMRRGDVEWISNEAPGVVDMAGHRSPPPPPPSPSPEPNRALFVLAHRGEPVAYADPHGHSLHWFDAR